MADKKAAHAAFFCCRVHGGARFSVSRSEMRINMEFLRIFNKKRIFILIALFIINGVFFFRECSDLEKYRLFDSLVSEFNIKNEDNNNGKNTVDMKRTALSVVRKYTKNNENLKEDEDFLEVREMFLKKVDYVKNYSENKREQIENSKAMLSLSLFSDKNSFSYLNIIKTRDDLSKIKDAKVTVSNGVWLEKVTSYKLIYYIMLIAAAMIVYAFIEDRKNGLIYIQYAATNGRGRLLIKRMFILLAFSIVTALLLFTEISVIALKMYGGLDGINASVCSDEMFAMCSMGTTRVMWLVINVLRISLGIFTVGLLMWGLLTCFNNSNIGLVVFVLLCSSEIIINGLITDKSIFRFFKFFNLKYLIEGGGAWFTYKNWGYDFIITDIAGSTYVLMILAVLIAVILLMKNCVLSNSLNHIGIVEKMFIRAYELMIKLFAKMPVSIMEFFKLIFLQRAGIIAIIVIVLFADMNKGYVLKYNILMSSISNFAESAKGASTEELSEIRESLYKERQELRDNVLDSTAGYKISITEAKIEFIEYILGKKAEGVDVSIISPYEYEAALGERQSDNQEFIALLCIVLMLMINVGAVSYEKKNGMLCHIRAAKNRDGWIRNKILYNGIFAFIITMFLYTEYYYELIKLYKLSDFGVSVKSLQMFDKYPLDIPIWAFIILDFILKLIVLEAVGGLAFLLSSIFSYETGYFVSLIIIMPHLLYKLGISIFSYISVPKLMAFMPFWTEGKCLYNLAGDVAVICMGIAGYIYTYRKTAG